MRGGVGGGVQQSGKMLSEYFIKRAEQYHPVIPIGAGIEITVVFQEGFQLEFIEQMRKRKVRMPWPNLFSKRSIKALR